MLRIILSAIASIFMELSTLKQKIVSFLTSFSNLNDSESQQAFIYSSGLDSFLYHQIAFGKPLNQFAPLLVSTLLAYGRLKDGRWAIKAVLEATKNYIGEDKKAYCDTLLEEIEIHAEELFLQKPTMCEIEEAAFMKKHDVIGGDNIVGTVNGVMGGQIAIGKDLHQIQNRG